MAIAIALGLTACSGDTQGDSANQTPETPDAALGHDPHANHGGMAALEDLPEGMTAYVQLANLPNPAGLAFRSEGVLMVCAGDAIHIAHEMHTHVAMSGFTTQFWKDADGEANDRFRHGPISIVYLPDGTAVVSDAGLTDGEDQLLIYPPGATDRSQAVATGGVATEGNLMGLCVAADGTTVYACGQGSDEKTWIIACDTAAEAPTLELFFSADEHGITANSPMQAILWNDNTLLVLYQDDATGDDPEIKNDGLLVAWNLETLAPISQWSLPELNDPMGMARIPGTDDLVVVAHNWTNANETLPGKLARVTLPNDGTVPGEPIPADVTVLSESLRGPVSCLFDDEGKLYISQLGPTIDGTEGVVLAVEGIR